MYDTGELKVKEKADKNNLLLQNVLRCNTLTFISRISIYLNLIWIFIIKATI